MLHRWWPRASRLVLLGALGLGAAATACKKDDPKGTEDVDTDVGLLAEDGTDSSAVETDAAVVISSLVATSGASSDLGSAGEGAKAIYFPKGCLDVTSNVPARQLVYVFDGCRGPNGILKITGTITATYGLRSGTLVLDLVGSSLVVNRATVDWSAHSEVSTNGAMRSMTWHATLSGTTARGRDFARTDDKTIAWTVGERCFAVDGVAEGTVKGRYLKTEIAGFKRCALACPEAGGRITISNEKKVKVEILYDGSDQATYTTPKGSVTFDLACRA